MTVDPADLSPPLLRIQERPPVPLAGWLLRTIFLLTACAVLWASFGLLDIVAVADGKLVPSSFLKIVQPAEQGIVKESARRHYQLLALQLDQRAVGERAHRPVAAGHSQRRGVSAVPMRKAWHEAGRER